MVHTTLLQPQSWSSVASGLSYPLLWQKGAGLLTQRCFPLWSSMGHPEHLLWAKLGSSDK